MDPIAQVASNGRVREKTLGRLLPRSFFELAPEVVAPRLLGKLIVHRCGSDQIGGRSEMLAGRIVETEAYLGPHNDPPDPAAHAHGGPTPRNLVLFGLAGHAYVYSIYGRYFCLNVSCEAEGQAGCVLIRALEPVAGLDAMARNRELTPGTYEPGSYEPRLYKPRIYKPERLARQLTSGPGRLCQALGLLRTSHNGLDVTSPDSPLQMLEDGFTVTEALATPRIGIKEAVDWPLRFAIPGNKCVSGPRSLTGKRVFIK